MKQTLAAFLSACLALTAACTKVETGFDIPKGKSNISLELTLPAQTAVATRSIDDSRENEVMRLDVFTFDAGGNLLANVGHQTIRSFNQPTGANGLSNKLEVSIVLDRSAAATQQFCVVANGRDEMFTGITTKTQLEAIEFGTSAMPRNLFVMTGSSLPVTVAALTSLPVTLTRSAARVDVKLAAAVTDFAIRSARIMQARTGAYAFQKLSGGYVTWPSTALLTDYSTVAIASSEERGFASKLYAFENYNPNPTDLDKTTVVILGGEYANSGTVTYYRIDIKDENDDLQIIRNNRYEITVNSVEGPGSVTEEDAVIGTANIRYSVDVWKESEVNAEFDGTTMLKVSENNIRLPRDASGGIIYVETTADAWNYTSPTNPDGTPAGWLTVRKDGDNCNYMATVNTSGVERTAYFYVRAGQKLRIKVKVTQAYGEAMIIRMSSTGITVPSGGTTTLPVSAEFTAERENVSWVIDPNIILLGYTGDPAWVSFVALQPMNGTGDGRVELNVAALTVPDVSRSAVVMIAATDVSTGVTEHYKFTVTQDNIEGYIKIDRTYIASTQTGAVHKITVSSNTEWIAEFTESEYSGRMYKKPLVAGDSKLITEFVADAIGTPLPAGNPDKTALKYKGDGDDVIYVRFKDMSGTADVRYGWTVFTEEGLDPAESAASMFVVGEFPPASAWMMQGIFGVVTINGQTILDRNLGATHYFDDRTNPGSIGTIANLYGHRYQWGRIPDGYESSHRGTTAPVGAYCTHNIVDKVPVQGIYKLNGVFLLGNWSRWFQVSPNTPDDQREFHKFWDANGKANYNAMDAATDGTGWTGLIENTNAIGVKTKFDPCPKGWRVPTAQELLALFEGGDKVMSDFPTTADKGRWMTSDGEGGKNVFFPAGGAFSKGTINATLYAPLKTLATSTYGSIGAEGYYMTSSIGGDESTFWYYFFDNDNNDRGIRWNRHPKTNASFMTGGMSVRCIKDDAGIY